MRSLFKLTVLMLVLTVLFSSVATTALAGGRSISSPYVKVEGGCITEVNMKSSETLLDAVTYYTATVTSHIQGESSREAIPYNVFGAIGSEDTRMFVYSVGSADNLDYANHTVLSIVEQFEKDNPAYDAVVAINGDFFDIETALTPSLGEPEGLMIQLGDVYKGSFCGGTGRGMVGVTGDGEMLYYTLGSAYAKRDYGVRLSTALYHSLHLLDEDGRTVAEQRAYHTRIGDKKTYFIAPDSEAEDLTGREVCVIKCDVYRHSHVNSIGHEAGTLGFYFEGEVTEIREGRANEKPERGYVLLSLPNEGSEISLEVGSEVKCERGITGKWADVTNAVGFKQQILAEGNVLLKNSYGTYNTSGDREATLEWTADIGDYPHCWKNRTAIGFREDGTPVFLVAQRSSHTGTYKNLGASYYELGEQLKSLGCVNGFLLDGGGSSTFVVRNEDGSFSNTFVGEGKGRAVGNAVILAVRDESVPLPEEETEPETEPDTTPETEPVTAPETAPVTEPETAPETEQEKPNGGCSSTVFAPSSALAVAAAAVSFFKRKKRTRS